MSDIRAFKREHGLAPEEAEGEPAAARGEEEETDLRAEDEALVAAALEAEESEEDAADLTEDEDADAVEDEEKPRGRRRGRRGGRGRRRKRTALEGTFDHGEEGYGLWLDPAVQDDPVYAEHWAGHRPVTIDVEPERIVIKRAGEDGAGG